MVKLMNLTIAAVSLIIFFSCSSQSAVKPDETQALKAENQSLMRQIDVLNEKIVSLSSEVTNNRITILDKLFFDEGSDVIHPEGRKKLDSLASSLKAETNKLIRVEGYTDDVPIAQSLMPKFPTNWELSTARADAIVRYLLSKGINPSLTKATGYGKYNPVASNDTAEGRALNRRIVIELVPLDTRSRM